MDPKDQPFGYTFNNNSDGDFYGASPTHLTHGGPHLLNEHENNLLLDFFTNTDPYMSEPPSAFPTDAKNGFDDYNWAGIVPPASVHQVSTTIADQAQLHHGFRPDQSLHSELSLSAGPYTNTQDDLRAASALFNNAQAAHMNARSYSVPNIPHGVPVAAMTASDVSASHFRTMPMVNTVHGPIDEQLAALLPHHSQQGSIDELVAAQFTQARHQHEADAHAQREQQRPSLKRSYTYGTDSAFHSNGYIAPEPGIEEAINQRLAHDLRIAQPIVRPHNRESLSSPVGHLSFARSTQSAEGEQSEEGTSDDDDRPAKKRRQSQATKNGKAPRKSVSRPAKNRKTSTDEAASKRKRLSSAGQKAQRENLSEEQKRSNHILSEQKRRNLIKRGFDDLHDLVPEIRNGGLSKSAILMAAADFLEGLINDNSQHAGTGKTDTD